MVHQNGAGRLRPMTSFQSPRTTKSRTDVLERITLAISSTLALRRVLEIISNGLVEAFDAAFARIWLLGPGDLCAACFKASDCASQARCLHLAASAGLYTNLNGEYRRVPLGALEIGLIAEGWGPMFTTNALEDERIPNKEWLRESGIQSFAGHPLIFQGELLGVLAMFSQRELFEDEFERLGSFANQAAIAIKNAQLFSEMERLNEQLRAENLYLQEEIKVEHNFEEIVSRAPAMKKVLKTIETVAPTDTTVLILGETGTEKELIARALHNLSGRRNQILVRVNCAALPESRIESELFGHEKGAFTGALAQKTGRFELAHRGTLFLEEIGDLPIELQVRLLRVLQEGEFERVGGTRTLRVDVRVIATTHHDLSRAMAEARFREDLYYQLSVFPIPIPPLRERPKDVPLLVKHFATKYAAKLSKRIDQIPKATVSALLAYSWPGNVRELENVIERAVILSVGPRLELGDWEGRRVGAG